MLVDTSVLIRTLQPHHPLYVPADRAIRLLPEQGRKLHLVAQNLIELWAVATRPVEQNGLGMTPDHAMAELETIKGMFHFCPKPRPSTPPGRLS
jgi:hypothetical protein